MGDHYVPQKYLNGFRDKSSERTPMIWQFDKQTGNFVRASIKSVANERGYYSPDDEKLLATKVEGPANFVLDRLRSRIAIDTEDRGRLAVYIAVMMMRVPRLRELRRQNSPQAIEEVCDEFRRWIEEAVTKGKLDKELANDRLQQIEAVRKRSKEVFPAPVEKQIKSPWPTVKIVELVAAMQWRLISSAGPSYFLTSDDPGSFFHCFGLGTEKSELIFPISSEVALHASHQPRPWRRILTIHQRLVKEINRRIAVGASRFVYYHERANWIRELVKNRIEQTNRIQS